MNEICKTYEIFDGPEKGRLNDGFFFEELFGAGVLGDGLGAFTHGVLGQLAGEQEPDGGLDLPGGDGRPLVVVGQAGRLGGDALEDVVDEAVHDAHRLGGNSGVGVDLLQDLVNVDGVAFLPLALLLLVSLRDVLLGLAGLLHGLSAGFRWHLLIFRKLESEKKTESDAFFSAASPFKLYDSSRRTGAAAARQNRVRRAAPPLARSDLGSGLKGRAPAVRLHYILFLLHESTFFK